MPQNAALAARTLWRTADAIWRAAGDEAADFSHYTKRATAGAVYSATLLVWLNDESRSEEHTSELQSLMRISYAVFCLKKKKYKQTRLPTQSLRHTHVPINIDRSIQLITQLLIN